MSESEWIKKYPFCFKAFLNNENVNILGVHFEDDAHYPESMIGAYLNWFLSKTGKDQEITRLKKALEIANGAIEFYGNKGNWIRSSMADVARKIGPEDLEEIKGYARYCGGLNAREAQKQIKEIMEEK